MRVATLVIALVLAALAGDAHAYPQFVLSNGDDRCGQCHLSWSGGGLISDYGRDEAGSTISRGGDGRFLHGLATPPDWLAVGGDFRFALGRQQLAGDGNTLAFPMQMDLSTRITKGAFSFALTAGVRGARGVEGEPRPELARYLISREHYLAYAGDKYSARIGRFFPIFGLRLVDHTAYVRRYMGFGLFEEPLAAEVTRDFERGSLHVTAFVPQLETIWAAGQQGIGGAARYEHRFDATIVGVQGRASLASEEARYTAGATVVHWLPGAKLLALAELNVQQQVFGRGLPGRTQVSGYLGVARWLTKGVLFGGGAHLWDPDLGLSRDSREAAELTLQYFPRAHFEVHALLRGSLQALDADEPGLLGLLQLHYYL